MWWHRKKVREYTLTTKTIRDKRLYWLSSKNGGNIYECSAQGLAEKLVDILATEDRIMLISESYGRTSSEMFKEYLYEREHFGRTLELPESFIKEGR